MRATITPDVTALPLAPKNPLPVLAAAHGDQAVRYRTAVAGRIRRAGDPKCACPAVWHADTVVRLLATGVRTYVHNQPEKLALAAESISWWTRRKKSAL